MNSQVAGFVDFIRKQGVVGLAVGFILGGAVSKVVTALVTDIINPLVGMVLGSAEGLKAASWTVGDATLMWGDFAAVLVDFLIIAAVVYYGVKGLGLDKLDKAKE
jgi:large conductance mechanosensitive channel